MAKHRDSEQRSDKGGYQPLNQGYTPHENRGNGPRGKILPKAPAGGTGQSGPAKPNGSPKG